MVGGGWVRAGASPPPTRGWTRQLGRSVCRQQVAPAHAGMDLQSWDIPPVLTCRPRPRGDGPPAGVFLSGLIPSPPPTRGWTPESESAMVAPCVAPAHAGMDPLPRGRITSGARRPRPRGDGPSGASRTGSGPWSPPPTRGWTHEAPRRHRPGTVAPAHAGMDPWSTASIRSWKRRPRPRGDGPLVDRIDQELEASPPPTRGWTPGVAAVGPRLHVAPAHAGMDRTPR